MSPLKVAFPEPPSMLYFSFMGGAGTGKRYFQERASRYKGLEVRTVEGVQGGGGGTGEDSKAG